MCPDTYLLANMTPRSFGDSQYLSEGDFEDFLAEVEDFLGETDYCRKFPSEAVTRGRAIYRQIDTENVGHITRPMMLRYCERTLAKVNPGA